MKPVDTKEETLTVEVKQSTEPQITETPSTTQETEPQSTTQASEPQTQEPKPEAKKRRKPAKKSDLVVSFDWDISSKNTFQMDSLGPFLLCKDANNKVVKKPTRELLQKK